jgi:hypothetical protein
MDSIALNDLAEHARHVYDVSDCSQAAVDGLVDLIGPACGVDVTDERSRFRVQTLILGAQLVPGFSYTAHDVEDLEAIAGRPVPSELDADQAESYREVQRALVARIGGCTGRAPSATGRTVSNVLKSLVFRKY